MPREHSVMREMGLDLSYHPPNGVESSCERSMMPGGLGTARGEKKQTYKPSSAQISNYKKKKVHLELSFRHSTEKQAFSSHPTYIHT